MQKKIEPDNRDNYSLNKHSIFDYNLEGARGLAALSVASFHVLSMKNFLDPTYHPHIYFGYLHAGHSSVLLFFAMYLKRVPNAELVASEYCAETLTSAMTHGWYSRTSKSE